MSNKVLGFDNHIFLSFYALDFIDNCLHSSKSHFQTGDNEMEIAIIFGNKERDFDFEYFLLCFTLLSR